ncbi:hypothetical protein FJQ87_18415 (plasmid) [Shewanella sp. SNU WT4]|uniref:hypothetical protein n=1 Tax=Shewanella sp. SNU WT4 TaxID=2590015 RepID=UPI0011288ED8|nr:hypothetical protein [Shewanella sp. SNU WT4]QDF68682.1 hypothetical protein FJQ87_18415 [Shewanella sp. SNU WT4]
MKMLRYFDSSSLELTIGHQNLNLESSAIAIMQKIDNHHLCSLPKEMSIADARKYLITAFGIEFLVTNSLGHWEGVVSYAELAPERILRMLNKTVTPLSLTVGDVMLCRENLFAITKKELITSTIEDVLLTLNTLSSRVLLVIDNNELCGIINSNNIIELLKLPIQTKKNNVADIVHQLRETHHLTLDT